ncbi:MAG: Holliday junction resolvase RuvX [Sedimentisphaerales bacterium]|jgi:putative Holliday junction resolvase
MRYLSIDYGNKITGLAICDQTETFVSPLMAIPTSNDLIGKIIEVVKAENVGALVLGLPLNMDDSVGPQAKKVQTFAAELKKQIDTPVFFQDERLSTFAAQGKMIDMDLTRKGKKRRIDALAAAEILQAFLDSKKATR